MLLKFCFLAFVFTPVFGKDAIHAEFAIGSDVVTAAIRKLQDTCIFPNDNLFLRRLAFVQSKDGHDLQNIWDSDKGRSGIWQITEDKLVNLQNFTEGDQLHSQLNVTFNDLNWRNGDLRIPLNSVAAARMYLKSLLNSSSLVPMSVNDQANLWVNKFNSSGNLQNFIDAVNKMPKCQTPTMDIIFIIDSSGSINRDDQQNYERVKTFLKKVIAGLGSQRTIKVGIVLFGDDAQLTFPLNDNLVLAFESAESLPYLNNGTNIASGIVSAHQEFLNSGRKNVPKVAILLTDGRGTEDSTPQVETLKNLGVNLFTIGVGNMTEENLVKWASNPSCMQYYKLDNFAELAESFPALLNFQLCEVSVTLALSQKCTTGIVRKNQYLFYEIEMDLRNDTAITLQLSNGGATLYTSKNSRLPSSADYDFMTNGTLTSPATIEISRSSDNSSKVYAAIVGIEDESSFILCRRQQKDSEMKPNSNETQSSDDLYMNNTIPIIIIFDNQPYYIYSPWGNTSGVPNEINNIVNNFYYNHTNQQHSPSRNEMEANHHPKFNVTFVILINNNKFDENSFQSFVDDKNLENVNFFGDWNETDNYSFLLISLVFILFVAILVCCGLSFLGFLFVKFT